LETLAIDSLTNLTKLDMSNNKISSMDFAANSNLSELNVANNQLTELNLIKNENISKLWCENNSNLINIQLSIYNQNTDMDNIIPNVDGLPILTSNNFLFASFNTTTLNSFTDFSGRLSAKYNVKSPALGNFLITKTNPAQSSLLGTSGALADLRSGSSVINSTNAPGVLSVMIAPINVGASATLPNNFMNSMTGIKEMDFRPLNNITT
jgi:hypothetical protein